MNDPALKGWERLRELVAGLVSHEDWPSFPGVEIPPPCYGAEVGVSRGWTTEHLLREFPTQHLFLIDIWDSPPKNSDYAKSGDGHAALTVLQQRVHRDHAAKRTEFAAERRCILAMDSTEASKTILDDTLDFAFIDGDHTYSGVKRDIEAWSPKVRPGGLLIGHDFNHPRDRRKLWGVTKAAKEFCEREGVEFHGDEKATIWWCWKP